MVKTLFMMLGYPGAGKTTAAESVAMLTGAVHLASDRIRLELFPEPRFTPEEHQQVYATIDARTKQLLEEGKSVIYDANLNRRQHRQDKYEICRQTGARPVLLWVQAPRQLAKDRATDFSRQVLWPSHETADELFERIANLIQVPDKTEPFVAISGTDISRDYIKRVLQAAKII
ncbi:MAG: AAA family ATPase [Candidatus Saccharimonadales bacterium]